MSGSHANEQIRDCIVNINGPVYMGERYLSTLSRERMIEMRDYFTQRKNICNCLLNMNGPVFMPGRKVGRYVQYV